MYLEAAGGAVEGGDGGGVGPGGGLDLCLTPLPRLGTLSIRQTLNEINYSLLLNLSPSPAPLSFFFVSACRVFE